MVKILFLDCDGTIRQPRGGAKFINHPRDQRIIPGADSAIARYYQQGYCCIGITNQGGVASGYKSLEDAIAEQRYTLKLFRELEAIYFCPDYEGLIGWKVTRTGKFKVSNHHRVAELMAHEQYRFRKPGAGMIMLASLEFEGILEESMMVGDRDEDEAAAAKAGVAFLWADAWRKSALV